MRRTLALLLLVLALAAPMAAPAFADPDCAGKSGNHFDSGGGNGGAPHHDSPACK